MYSRTEAAILPRILPSATSTRTRLFSAEAASGDLAEQALDLPRALGGLERRILLARLVLKWASRLDPSGGDAPLVIHSPRGRR